jgi:uncharacterized protein YjdB
MRKLTFIIIISVMLLAIPINSAYASALFTIGSTQYTADNQIIQMDVAPYIEDNRTFLPLRFVANALGIADSNIFYDPTSQKVTIIKGSSVVQLTIGSTIMLANGAPIMMDVAPEIEAGRTCLPIAWIAQALGTNITWDATTQTITLGDNSSSQQTTPSTTAATSITVQPNTISMVAGGTQQLTVAATMADGSTADVTNAASYSSSDTSVAVISSNGLVACVAQGTATITVACSGQTSNVFVTVSASAAQPTSSVSPFQPTSAVVPSLQYDNIQTVSKNFEWQYNGTDYAWQVEVPSDLLTWDRQVNSITQQFYSSNGLGQDQILNSASNIKDLILANSAYRNSNYVSFTNETANSQWVGYLAKDLDASAQSAGYDYFHEADFILSFIGSAIPYVVTSEAELPAQTLVDSGDCKDKSILYASILKSLGYGVVLLSYPDVSGNTGHIAVGVAFDDGQLPQGNSLSYYLRNGTKYYYAETTEPNWTIGDNNGSIVQNRSAYVYVVN